MLIADTAIGLTFVLYGGCSVKHRLNDQSVATCTTGCTSSTCWGR